MTLFGTSGIRGEAENLFTDQFCFDIGSTFATFLNEKNIKGAVAVGMDPRGSSPRITRAIEAGISFRRREVLHEGATPVPSMNYILIANKSLAGSLMITGSHIKDYLNGVKFFFKEKEILKADEKEIENIYSKIKNKFHYPTKDFELLQEQKAKDEYIEMLLKKALAYPKLKVVVDAGDGAQSDIMPLVLQHSGLDLIEINTTIQGKFYARDTEVEADFANLKKEVIENKADLGLGYDSDGDRVVCIDKGGIFVPGDYTATIIAKYLDVNCLVTPINSSQVCEKINKKVVRTKVGSPFVVEKMLQEKCDFGFEANGGCIFKEMLSRDGGRTTIELLNIMAKTKKTLRQLLDELPRYFIYREKLDYDPIVKEAILEVAEKNFRGKKIEKIDGLKIWLDENSWILFRASANAPEFRVFSESETQAKAKKLLLTGLKLVKIFIN